MRECVEATSMNSGIPCQSFFRFPTARPNYFSHPLTLLLLHTFKGFTLLSPRKIKQLQLIAS